MDVNKDGFDDMVVSSKPYEGDELIFFVKEGNSYQFKLKSVNLSQDGGNIIDSIYAPNTNKGVLAIKTYFLDGGYLTATHYINYNTNDWTLTNTIYETQYVYTETDKFNNSYNKPREFFDGKNKNLIAYIRFTDSINDIFYILDNGIVVYDCVDNKPSNFEFEK